MIVRALELLVICLQVKLSHGPTELTRAALHSSRYKRALLSNSPRAKHILTRLAFTEAIEDERLRVYLVDPLVHSVYFILESSRFLRGPDLASFHLLDVAPSI